MYKQDTSLLPLLYSTSILRPRVFVSRCDYIIPSLTSYFTPSTISPTTSRFQYSNSTTFPSSACIFRRCQNNRLSRIGRAFLLPSAHTVCRPILMSSAIRWRCPGIRAVQGPSSHMRPLRHISLNNAAIPIRSYSVSQSGTTRRASRSSFHYHQRGPQLQYQHQHQHHFSKALRTPQPQYDHSSQRRVYQTSSPALASPFASASTDSSFSSLLSTPTVLLNPTPGCRSLLSLSDLPQHPQHPRSLSFSTSTRPCTSSSSQPTSSCSHPLATLFAPYSRKQRRKLARWLPAVMATQARSHSDESHKKSDGHDHDHDHDHDHAHDHGHSHGLFGGHHHHHDNSYLTSHNKNDAGVRITRVGLYCNLGMAIAKGAGGYYFNSQSMVADAWHSLTDLASDFLTLATVSWSLKPPTDKFPTGFGKVESLGSLGVSGMLLGGGIFMCISSMQSLYAHLFLDAAAAAELLAHGHGHSHGHSHGVSTGGPSLHAAWLALGTVLIKEWLYRASTFYFPFFPFCRSPIGTRAVTNILQPWPSRVSGNRLCWPRMPCTIVSTV